MEPPNTQKKPQPHRQNTVVSPFYLFFWPSRLSLLNWDVSDFHLTDKISINGFNIHDQINSSYICMQHISVNIYNYYKEISI